MGGDGGGRCGRSTGGEGRDRGVVDRGRWRVGVCECTMSNRQGDEDREGGGLDEILGVLKRTTSQFDRPS